MQDVVQTTVSLGAGQVTLRTAPFGFIRATAEAQRRVRDGLKEGSGDPLAILADDGIFQAMCLVIAASAVDWISDKGSPENRRNLEQQALTISALVESATGSAGMTDLMNAYTEACRVTYPEAFEKKTPTPTQEAVVIDP